MKKSDNDCHEFHCLRCGDCCEDKIPLDIIFLKRFRGKFQQENFQAKHLVKMKQLMIITENGKCVFLCPDNSCAIYPHRPIVCRWYGKKNLLECPKVSPDGKIRSKEEQDRIIAKNSDPSQWSDEYKKRLDDAAKRKVVSDIKKGRI
jgi:Fe-S-cluster containining protein